MWATTNAGFRSHVFLTLGATVSFCQRLCVVTDANNVGKTPKFLSSSTPTLFFINNTGHKWKAQQFFTRHDNREHNIKLSVTTNYSQLLTTHQPPHPTRHSTDTLAETQATANPLQATIVYSHDCHLLMPIYITTDRDKRMYKRRYNDGIRH